MTPRKSPNGAPRPARLIASADQRFDRKRRGSGDRMQTGRTEDFFISHRSWIMSPPTPALARRAVRPVAIVIRA